MILRIILRNTLCFVCFRYLSVYWSFRRRFGSNRCRCFCFRLWCCDWLRIPVKIDFFCFFHCVLVRILRHVPLDFIKYRTFPRCIYRFCFWLRCFRRFRLLRRMLHRSCLHWYWHIVYRRTALHAKLCICCEFFSAIFTIHKFLLLDLFDQRSIL